MRLIRTMLASVMVLAITALPAQIRANDESISPDERSETFSEITTLMQEFTIAVGEDRKQQLALVEAPVLRYSDAIASAAFAKIPDGALFVWTRNGRPEAVTAAHIGTQGRLWTEFLSLVPIPLTAMRNEQPHWFPKNTGVEFKPLQAAPPPEATAPRRLAQMRSIAQTFSASVSDPQAGRQELRLLPKPVFRYAQPDRGILDGAIFVFARSTNPEMLLLLEARVDKGKQHWVYSPARFTGREGEMHCPEGRVWSHVAFSGLRDPNEPFYQVSLSVKLPELKK